MLQTHLMGGFAMVQTCSRVLLTDQQMGIYHRRMQDPLLESVIRKAVVKDVQ